MTALNAVRGVHGFVCLPVEERFWSRVRKGDGCWEWLGYIQKDRKRRPGYGSIYQNGVRKKAHRLSWELANGREVPEGMFVCHRCDNPRCVRPDHLFLGTNRDNMKDAGRKGRIPHPKRERCRKGHLKVGDNAIVRTDGSTICRMCRDAGNRARYRKDAA